MLTFANFHERQHKVQMNLIWTKLVDPMQKRQVMEPSHLCAFKKGQNNNNQVYVCVKIM